MKSSVIKLLATGLMVILPALNADSASFDNLTVLGQEAIQGSNTSINAVSGWVDFDVHNDVLTITPCDGASTSHGAWVELQYCGIALKENGSIPVTYINKGMFIHPTVDKCYPCKYDACCKQVCPVVHIKACNDPIISDYNASGVWTRDAVGSFGTGGALESIQSRSYLDTVCCNDQLGRSTLGLANFFDGSIFGDQTAVVDADCKPVPTGDCVTIAPTANTYGYQLPGKIGWYDIAGAVNCGQQLCPPTGTTPCPAPTDNRLTDENIFRTYKADGHLFFRVYGCNVKAVSKNPIAASCFYLLGEQVQGLILDVAGNDTARRDKIADALCGFGSTFLNIFINLPSATQELIIAKVDSEACKGRKASLETALSVLMNQKSSSSNPLVRSLLKSIEA